MSTETVQAVPQTASAQRAGQVGYADHTQTDVTAADLRVDRDFIVQGQLGTSGETEAQIANLTVAQELEVKANNVLSDILKLSDFRDKVIAAFKHLGLDTRKHFGV